MIMGISLRWTLPAETRQIDGSIESVPCELQKPLGARRVPAAVCRVGAELALDLLALERLVHAAADMRLALLEHAAVPEGHLYVAGVGLRVRIVGVDDVTNFGGERENARVAHGFFRKGLEPGAAGDERDRDIEGRAEFGGVVVRRALLGCERLPQPVHVTFGGLAQDLGDVVRGETLLSQSQRAVDIGLVHGSGRVRLERETFHQPMPAEIARERLEIAFPVMSEGEKKSVRAFEHGTRPEKPFAPDTRGMQSDTRRPSGVQALGPGPFGEVFDDPARHAAGDAERVDGLLAVEAERGRYAQRRRHGSEHAG